MLFSMGTTMQVENTMVNGVSLAAMMAEQQPAKIMEITITELLILIAMHDSITMPNSCIPAMISDKKSEIGTRN